MEGLLLYIIICMCSTHNFITLSASIDQGGTFVRVFLLIPNSILFYYDFDSVLSMNITYVIDDCS